MYGFDGVRKKKYGWVRIQMKRNENVKIGVEGWKKIQYKLNSLICNFKKI